MELTYVTIIVLASMIFALAGMMGYLYWQQTRMLQHIQSLSSFVSSQIVEHNHEQPEPEPEPEPELEPVVEAEPQPTTEPESDSEDDRLSVEEKVEVVSGPPRPTVVQDKSSSADIDDLQDKTAIQLRELLTQKGIPFGKRDSKPVLLQLLKAIA
jgi:hypothetical protein